MPIFPLQKNQDSQNYSSGILSFVIQFAVVAVIFFAIGFVVGQKKIEIARRGFVPKITFENRIPPQDQTVDFSLLWKVMETLPEKYLDKTAIDSQKLLYGAISGAVRSLGDPYTAFLDPKQNQAVKAELSGTYEGVGIQIGFNKEKRLVVIAPLAGTPAEKARISPKDLILKIDSRETFDLTLPEAVDLIRGQAGTKVKLVLQHEGEDKPYEVEIAREKITVKSVDVEFKDTDRGRVAIVRVSRFGDTTDSEWDSTVNRLQLEKAVGVIVDMRNNPGGLLTSAVHLGSEFITGTIVKQEFADGTVRSLSADHRGELLSIPLVVLVNDGSASASEIFAGAIKDDRRGKVIGEKTFGKGTVQDAVDLDGGSGLHVTVAKWLTPKGTSINGEGITPDIIVARTSEDVSAGRDPQLDRALAELFK